MRISQTLTIFLLWGGVLLSPRQGDAQTVLSPQNNAPSSFAVITDLQTFEKCRPSLESYKRMLESEGLGVYVIAQKWQSPDEVRARLQELYLHARLEGCVLVGDVPVAMVTRAQHLTSAFKMDERKNDIHEASVPSDRFYDDFDLEFLPQGTPAKGLFHYYELAPTSLQYISCDIYSGRIRAQKSLGDPYRQISRYLDKAVEAHRTASHFDRFVSYTGHGSYSNSLVAWRSEQLLLDEQFGDAFRHGYGAKFLRYSMLPWMKEQVIRELRRPDVDMMVFHEHGMPHRQYLSGTPYVTDAEEAVEELGYIFREQMRRSESNRRRMIRKAEEMGLDTTVYCNLSSHDRDRLDSIADLRSGILVDEVADIAPCPRFVLFDACYNGDFREEDFIAGHYIMSEGDCVVSFANSVNVLQDKSAFDLLGLLGEGLRIGAWAKNIHILESHVIGDPTYHFRAAHPEWGDFNELARSRDVRYWRSVSEHPLPDMQNLAAIRLYEAGDREVEEFLLGQVLSSPYAVVRYNAFRLLHSLGGAAYKEALHCAAHDSFEFMRRVAVTQMGRTGDEDFIPELIDLYVRDRHAARIVFNIGQSLLCFEPSKVQAAIEEYFASKTFFHAGKYRDELLAMVTPHNGKSSGEEAVEVILNPDERMSWRLMYISFLKNRPYHQHLDRLLPILLDSTQPEELRVRLAESLAWFDHSVFKPQIIRAGYALLESGEGSEELHKEVLRMIRRLESEK